MSNSFDFDRMSVRLSDVPELVLSPGDKVLRERVVGKARFSQKAVVVRETAKKVTIKEVWVNKRTKEKLFKTASVERFHLYRHNWVE